MSGLDRQEVTRNRRACDRHMERLRELQQESDAAMDRLRETSEKSERVMEVLRDRGLLPGEDEVEAFFREVEGRT